jgi:hypothetical protein
MLKKIKNDDRFFTHVHMISTWRSHLDISTKFIVQGRFVEFCFSIFSLEEMWGYVTILFATTCNYVSFTITFATIYQLHQIWGRFATILRLMYNCIFHLFIWMLLGLYSSMNKFPWSISWMCNQNVVTNWCTMGMISIHIWVAQFTKSIYTIICSNYEYYQHIFRF